MGAATTEAVLGERQFALQQHRSFHLGRVASPSTPPKHADTSSLFCTYRLNLYRLLCVPYMHTSEKRAHEQLRVPTQPTLYALYFTRSLSHLPVPKPTMDRGPSPPISEDAFYPPLPLPLPIGPRFPSWCSRPWRAHICDGQIANHQMFIMPALRTRQSDPAHSELCRKPANFRVIQTCRYNEWITSSTGGYG